MNNPAQDFLDHLAALLSLPGLRFNEDRVCCLFQPGALEIQMEWVPEGARLFILAPIGTLDNDPTRMRMLLEANFLFGGTRGESLSLEPASDRVFLCSTIALGEVSTEHAISIFERFVDTASQWRGVLDGQAEPIVPTYLAASLRA